MNGAANSQGGDATALGPRELVQLLLDAGLLERETLVASQFGVRQASQRNHNYVVQCDSGPAYFVKQGVSQTTRATLSREAAFYKGVVATHSPLHNFIPSFVCFLPESCVLVLQLVEASTSLGSVRNRRPATPFFARLGRTMAILHQQTGLPGIGAGRRPSSTHLGSLMAKDLANISAAGIELVRTIQQFPEYEKLLSAISFENEDPCLTHNDLKSANCLIARGRTPVLIDWEFAAVGDPAWDLGCMLADFLFGWLMSIPLGSQIGADQLITVATRPIEGLHPSINAFWCGYVLERGLSVSTASDLLTRATHCAGTRLAQKAYELCQHSTSLTAAEVYLLQLSWNILKRPAEAIVQLFGLSLGAQESSFPPMDQGI